MLESTVTVKTHSMGGNYRLGPAHTLCRRGLDWLIQICTRARPLGFGGTRDDPEPHVFPILPVSGAGLGQS